MPVASKSRRMKAGASPMPCGPGSTCGHEGCGEGTCRVKYVGPVSHPRDHHIMMAAHGATHIWAAAVITSLALVVTGAIAFQSVQADQTQRAQVLAKQNANRNDIADLKDQLKRMDMKLDKIMASTVPAASLNTTDEGGLPAANDKK